MDHDNRSAPVDTKTAIVKIQGLTSIIDYMQKNTSILIVGKNIISVYLIFV